MHTNYRLPSLSGFCHFDLVLFMVLSPDTPIMSCFYVSAWLWVCLFSVCLVSCWSVVFGSRHLCFEFRFRIEVRKLGILLSMFCLVVWACGLEFAQPCALLSTCVLWCCTQFVFLSAVCIHVISCAVWHLQLEYFIGCVLSCCHVLCERGLWVFSLAACLCPVLHMAGDLFCWPCACVFVLCEHMASVLIFCVPCALMSIVLTPTNLLTYYWLIYPTCVYLVSLLICSLYNLLVFAVLCQFVIDVTLCHVLSCPAKPCCQSVFPYGVVFVCCCFGLVLLSIKRYSAVLSPRLIPLHKPDILTQ